MISLSENGSAIGHDLHPALRTNARGCDAEADNASGAKARCMILASGDGLLPRIAHHLCIMSQFTAKQTPDGARDILYCIPGLNCRPNGEALVLFDPVPSNIFRGGQNHCGWWNAC